MSPNTTPSAPTTPATLNLSRFAPIRPIIPYVPGRRDVNTRPAACPGRLVAVHRVLRHARALRVYGPVARRRDAPH
ncbi:hypothetical protein JCM9533A_06380 [Catenuloplanes niger JCM 9533]